jgi:hypothetical protein
MFAAEVTDYAIKSLLIADFTWQEPCGELVSTNSINSLMHWRNWSTV